MSITYLANKAIVRRVFAEGVTDGDMAVIDAAFSHSVDHSDLASGHLTPNRIRRHLGKVRATFPDICVTIEELIAEGDRVASVETWRGTHGTTGERVEGTIIHVFRFENGQVVKEWNEGWGWWERLRAAGTPAVEAPAAG